MNKNPASPDNFYDDEVFESFLKDDEEVSEEKREEKREEIDEAVIAAIIEESKRTSTENDPYSSILKDIV